MHCAGTNGYQSLEFVIGSACKSLPPLKSTRAL